MMLNIHIFYAKIIDKIFRECLCFLIIVINNCNYNTINELENIINYENVIDVNKHVKCVQFVK